MMPESFRNSAMPLLRLVPSIIALALSGMAAGAADLPRGTRLGAIFADSYEDRPVVYQRYESSVAIVPWTANSPRVPGYYGRPGDFYYTSYYGTPPDIIFGRLPYACGLYGLC
jgi:hypothetical protein